MYYEKPSKKVGEASGTSKIYFARDPNYID
jgi:hypothetical protein